MNGRVYDYNMGRFMSVDPLIVNEANSQSINPYSYVMNNPLKYYDPTGYATEVKEEKIRRATTGSRIKKVVGTKKTTTITDDNTGAVTSAETVRTDVKGNYTSSAITYDNGKASSATVSSGDKNGNSL
jgi:exo-beta-1,3-glucanase (GH17 family)